MKTQSMLIAALASAPAALAHTVFAQFYADGQPQGDGTALRMSPNAETAGSPIASLDSDDMACNVGGTKGVSRVQSVRDGALLSFEIREWANDPSKGRIDRGHKGPCAVYLKKVDSAVNDRAAGDGWFKIFDHGYDASTDRWCSDEIIDNNGLLNANLPKGLAGGYYLARPEMLALHNAAQGDPQFYTGCAQIFVESSGNLVPEETVSIPGYVAYGQPATSFDIYNTDASKYTVPGPKVARLAPGGGGGSGSDAQTTQSEGLKPAGCLAENANWCGVEVPSYSTEAGCWSAGENCWAQADKCWNSAPPTGGAGCELWSTKCEGIQAACSAKNFNGPPNKNKVLSASKPAVDVGKVMATVGGGFADAPKAPQTTAKSDNGPKTETPAQTTYDAPQAQPTSGGDSYEAAPPADKEESSKPTHTITVAPEAPAPTAAPEQCPEGWYCVTVTEVETYTQTVYVTAAYDSYKKRGSFARRS